MSQLPPNVPPPTREQLRSIAEQYYFDLGEEELAEYAELIDERMAIYEALEALPEPDLDPQFSYGDRSNGYRPGSDEDPLNAHITKCTVQGAEDGPLAGYDVGVKDNIAVAGIEMTCGSKVLEGYVPRSDAVAVERVLEAGGTITSKTNMDEMAVSGSGEMTPYGPIHNPRVEGYLAGGSSGGSAAAVVDGDVDVAIGTDQAGSLRVPASWCGCVGFKPTHGLVPYRGASPQGHSWDHLGPITTTVADAARVLEVLAGPDDLDPRSKAVEPGSYVDAVSEGVDDVRIGVLEEGFGFERTDEGVDDAARAGIDALESEGATVETVSIPWHVDAFSVTLGIEIEEVAAMWDLENTGYFAGGAYDTHMSQAFANARRARADEFAPTVVLLCLLGGYMRRHHQGRYHGKAMNLRRELTEAYDEAFEDVDLLAMPTTPLTAFELESNLSRTEIVNRAQGKEGRTTNTMPFNLTGHPAMSIPCGTADGLPVGLMFVGAHCDEESIVRTAATYESTVDWQEQAY
ncbi:amidase [Natrarchaeobius chitinivorans]|uniref:Amidase n=1 Tax=Natrarchaeobius chitinivorans TaxID=1679083 RepID=A0A3N6PE12_NATCH|nr:amidase [Natrarchaeobius chitinivorans]RQG95405.1 amidase [Natrarchaeobius chitinivorans]